MTRPTAIGVVVPAHDEAQAIGACLDALDAAARTPRLAGLRVEIVVACDACTDETAAIVAARGHRAVTLDARNVGLARAAGAAAVLALGVDWLAFTDADTRVYGDWISAQLAVCAAVGADVVCGTVSVDDWGGYGDAMRRHFEATYRDRDGHRHIHGANLAMSAAAYRRVGGFAALANSEDVAIVEALEAAGAQIAWSAAPRVVTSARTHFRATAGFGARLQQVAATLADAATTGLGRLSGTAATRP